jgi:hypothetical protein
MIPLKTLLAIAVPMLLLQLILLVVALVDLVKREPERINGPKWLWAVIIICISMFGPIIYFIAGRRNS